MTHAFVELKEGPIKLSENRDINIFDTVKLVTMLDKGFEENDFSLNIKK